MLYPVLQRVHLRCVLLRVDGAVRATKQQHHDLIIPCHTTVKRERATTSVFSTKID